MREDAQRLLDEALKLPSPTRAELVGRLLETLEADELDAPDPSVDAAWEEEIARRVARLDAGEVKPVPWAEVQRELRARRKG